MLDTLRASHTLRDAGFTEDQAVALVTVLRDELATKDDMAAGFAAMRAELTRQFTIMHGSIATASANLRADLVQQMSDSHRDTLKWVIGMIFVGIATNLGTTIAVVKFLHP